VVKFTELGLSEEILKVLKELEFEKPTDIQQKAIPLLMEGDRDFIGIAQTGTGKTAAFGLPLLEQIDPDMKHTQALVLAPTRELGKQIAEQLATFSKYLFKLNVLPVYGGEAIMKQIKALKKPQHIIIATPGRLIDLVKRKAINLQQIQFVVLDEADEMLNMGFKDELDEILSFTPDEKLTWLFSATMPKAIRKIVKDYMEDPIEIKVNSEDKVNVNISHEYTVVKQSDKAEALIRFLDMDYAMRGVVFCRTRRDTQELAETLLQKNYKADALHGDLSQQQRDRVMKRFKKHDLQVLIATDVAARGIDVNDLTHVFHYTLPDDVSYYTHRSGRTARAGKKGTSISFINGKEKYKINRLERDLGIAFDKVLVPSSDIIATNRIEQWCTAILEKETKNKIDADLLETATNIFASLSKEDLISKLMLSELEQMGLAGSRDLNQDESSRSSRGGDGGRGASRGGGYRGGGGRGRSSGRSGSGRSSSGRSNSGRSGSGRKYGSGRSRSEDSGSDGSGSGRKYGSGRSRSEDSGSDGSDSGRKYSSGRSEGSSDRSKPKSSRRFKKNDSSAYGGNYKKKKKSKKS